LLGNPLTQSADVLVIGAGIVGAACANALSQAGLRVTVIEKDVVGGGATAAGMGHLVVMDDSPAELALTRYSLQLWREFTAQMPALHEYSNCGTLWIAADDDEYAAAQDKARKLQSAGVNCEMLDEKALYESEPHLRAGLRGGLLVAGDALVYPPKSARLLLESAQRHGANVLTGEVRSLARNAVRLANGASVSAAHVIVANGISATQLLPELPLRAKKGHLAITDRYPGMVRHQLVELAYIKNAHADCGDSISFNVQPRPTGQLLIGSTRQFDIADSRIDQRMMSRMLSRALEYLPVLQKLHVLRCWTGLRAATPDGLPLIGAHPALSNVSLAVGHEGLGVTTSLATAQMLRAQILGKPSPLPMAAYSPSRFPLNEVAYA
jgi:glycine/D-amino acid oxidase-like deaminating enzyme